MTDTPQERIAAAIVAEMQRQINDPENPRRGSGGYLDAENGTDGVCLDGWFDLDKVGEALIDSGLVADIAADRPRPWRCFHCDQLLWTEEAARQHFGPHEGRKPACQIKGSEGGLIRALREAEDEVEKVHTDLHAESADGLMAMRGNLGRHRVALVSAEETGYERGLADQAKTIEILRRALAWHGELARMATTREEWQQEIDEAIRWVKDNPEEGRPSFSTWGNN